MFAAPHPTHVGSTAPSSCPILGSHHPPVPESYGSTPGGIICSTTPGGKAQRRAGVVSQMEWWPQLPQPGLTKQLLPSGPCLGSPLCSLVPWLCRKVLLKVRATIAPGPGGAGRGRAWRLCHWERAAGTASGVVGTALVLQGGSCLGTAGCSRRRGGGPAQEVCSPPSSSVHGKVMAPSRGTL